MIQASQRRLVLGLAHWKRDYMKISTLHRSRNAAECAGLVPSTVRMALTLLIGMSSGHSQARCFEKRWERRFDHNFLIEVSPVVLNDGGVLLLLSNTNDSRFTRLIKLDADGREIWSRDGGAHFSNRPIELPDGRIALVDMSGQLFVFAADGTVQHVFQVLDHPYDRERDPYLTSNGKVLLSQIIKDRTDNSGKARVFVFDTHLNLIADTLTLELKDNYWNPSLLIPMHEGRTLLVAQGMADKVYLILLDANGREIFRRVEERNFWGAIPLGEDAIAVDWEWKVPLKRLSTAYTMIFELDGKLRATLPTEDRYRLNMVANGTMWAYAGERSAKKVRIYNPDFTVRHDTTLIFHSAQSVETFSDGTFFLWGYPQRNSEYGVRSYDTYGKMLGETYISTPLPPRSHEDGPLPPQRPELKTVVSRGLLAAFDRNAQPWFYSAEPFVGSPNSDARWGVGLLPIEEHDFVAAWNRSLDTNASLIRWTPCSRQEADRNM